MKRNATAVWLGPGKEGKGHLTTQSGALHQSSYTVGSRFEQNPGTNPEELMAAAHAGCFSMKLSIDLNAAGFPPQEIQTSCDITMENLTITKSELHCTVKVPGLDNARFQEIATKSKNECPVSRAFGAIEISLDAKLA